MVIIHAQPYDDHGLRALLMPDGCEMLCLMGIKPGVTTVDDAIRLLQASGWVDKVETSIDLDSEAINTIFWRWTVNAPALIRVIGNSQLNVVDDRIDSILIASTISLGDIWLSLGKPAEYQVTTFRGVDHSALLLVYDNVFTEYGLGVLGGGLSCPFFSKLWKSTVTIHSIQGQKQPFLAQVYRDGFFAKQAFNLDRRICKG